MSTNSSNFSDAFEKKVEYFITSSKGI